MREPTSASNIDRRARCPGSERMEAGLREQDSDISQEGDLLHAMDADKTLSRISLNPEQRDLLDLASELDQFVFDEVEKQFEIVDAECIEGRELEMWLHRGLKAVFPGHCDRWRYYPAAKVLVIIDKKFGFKEVTPAASNLQLRSYAVMGSELRDCAHVAVAITQPRLRYEQRVTMAAYDRYDIQKSRAQLLSVFDAAKDPDAPLTAGEEQCRYCKAKIVCPAYREKFTFIQQYSSMALADCSDGQLDEILVAIQFADHIKDQAREEARRRIEEGSLSNWKLEKGSSVRNVTDTAKAIALLSEEVSLTTDDAIACSKLSLSKIEEKVRAKLKCTAKAARDEVNAALGPVIEITPKKASITRVSAPIAELEVA